MHVISETDASSEKSNILSIKKCGILKKTLSRKLKSLERRSIPIPDVENASHVVFIALSRPLDAIL